MWGCSDRVTTPVGLRAAREHGVQFGRPAKPERRSGEIIALKKQGMCVRAIAWQLKMPPSSVHKALQLPA